MDENSRIGKARELLKLFVKGLPEECCFSIISFGDFMKFYEDIEDQKVINYRQSTSERVIKSIDGFRADMGCTEILPPLKSAM